MNDRRRSLRHELHYGAGSAELSTKTHQRPG